MVTAFRNIILALLILSLLPINSVAETEINLTLEDNVVFLLDYSWGAWNNDNHHWFYIKSNVKDGFKDGNVKSNISIIAYGYGNSTKSSTINKNILINSDLEDFLQSTLPQSFDGGGDNLSQAFTEAKNILDNATTGSKQIILISNGNIDGKRGIEKLNNSHLIDLVRNLKKNNITINLSQVLDSNFSQKEKEITQPYSDLGKETNTNIVVLNNSERMHFVNHEIEKPKQKEGERGDYSYELFDNTQMANITDSMMYQNEEISFSDNYKAVDFYEYWDGYNYIVIPISRNEGVFDEQAMREIFRGKDAIKMVQSGNITERAYLILSDPILNLICGYFDESDTFSEESKNLIGENLPKKPKKIFRNLRLISKSNVPLLILSGECKISTYDDLPEKIIDGGRYTYNLKNRYAYNGIVNDFKNYNDGLIKLVDERNNDLMWTLIYIVNAPIYYQAEPLLKMNSNRLSELQDINYSKSVELAIKQINKKEMESDISILNASNQVKELEKQIKNGIKNGDLNEKQKLKEKAQKYLDAAIENQSKSKFNTAIQNADKSYEIAGKSMGESEYKSTPTISIVMSIVVFIIVVFLIKRK